MRFGAIDRHPCCAYTGLRDAFIFLSVWRWSTSMRRQTVMRANRGTSSRALWRAALLLGMLLTGCTAGGETPTEAPRNTPTPVPGVPTPTAVATATVVP